MTEGMIGALVVLLPVLGLEVHRYTRERNRHRAEMRALVDKARQTEREDSQRFALDLTGKSVEQLAEFAGRAQKLYEGALLEMSRLRSKVEALETEIDALKVQRRRDAREIERMQLHLATMQRVAIEELGKRLPSIPAPPPEDHDNGNGGM